MGGLKTAGAARNELRKCEVMDYVASAAPSALAEALQESFSSRVSQEQVEKKLLKLRWRARRILKTKPLQL